MDNLRFGTFLAPNMLPVYRAIAGAVGERVGIPTELVIETDYENCMKDVNDVCFVCSLPYVVFERDEGGVPAVPIAAPVLVGDRYGESPIYFSDVIVRSDDPAETFLDLRGRSWAYNEPLSQSGYGITRYHLISIGETNGFFGEVIQAGFHETAITMVRDGLVDASAIDSQVLAVAMLEDPSLADSIKVIEALGPSTIQPVAVSKRLPGSLTADIQDVLLGMHEVEEFRPILAAGTVDRFVEVDGSAYDDIRDMLSACETANFMEIR